MEAASAVAEEVLQSFINLGRRRSGTPAYALLLNRPRPSDRNGSAGKTRPQIEFCDYG